MREFTLVNLDMLKNEIQELENRLIPEADKLKQELNEKYTRTANAIIAARHKEGTTLSYEQTEDLLNVLAELNFNTRNMSVERDSNLRCLKRLLQYCRRPIIVKIVEFFKK